MLTVGMLCMCFHVEVACTMRRGEGASEPTGESSGSRETQNGRVEDAGRDSGELFVPEVAPDAENAGAEFEDDLIDEGEDDIELDSEAERVETGDTYVVYTDRPENGDRFFLVLCDMPVHNNKATFTDGWGCTWPTDTMLISGTYYRRLPSVGRDKDSFRYELLENEPKAWNYSHLVVQSKVELLQYKSNKRNPRFKMSAETREEILSNVEERQSYNAH